MSKPSGFSTIGDILGKLFSNPKWDSKAKQYSLWKEWKNLVGSTIANQATPLRWAKNRLVVGVKDSCWLMELKMIEKEIVEKIRQASPDLKIEGIHWVLK